MLHRAQAAIRIGFFGSYLLLVGVAVEAQRHPTPSLAEMATFIVAVGLLVICGSVIVR